MTDELIAANQTKEPSAALLQSDGKPAQKLALSAPVLGIPVVVQVIVGSASMPLSQVLQLAPGDLITLDQKVGDLAVILVNSKEIAHGELVVLDGEAGQLGISISKAAATREPDIA